MRFSYFVVAVAIVIAALLYFRSRNARGARDSAGEPSSVDVAPATPEWIDHLKRLVALNIAIRENGLSDEVVARLEETIDVLRGMLPELNDAYAGGELTWTVNRMASDYLPRIVEPFVRLSPGAREEHRAELLGSLSGLEAELQTIRGLVRDRKVGEFQTKAAFLRARFLEGSLG